jgi:hypothetical protein
MMASAVDVPFKLARRLARSRCPGAIVLAFVALASAEPPSRAPEALLD